MRNENRAVDNDHGRPVGQRHHQVTTDHANIGQFDSRRKGHDTVAADHDARCIGRHLGQITDIDHQPGIVAGAALVGERVTECVGHTGGRVGIALVTVIATRIDAQRAILALDFELAAAETGVTSARAVDRSDPTLTRANQVKPGRAGDGAGTGDDVAGRGTVIARREMICVIARIDLAQTRQGSIFVSHNPPSPLRHEAMMAGTADCDLSRTEASRRLTKYG